MQPYMQGTTDDGSLHQSVESSTHRDICPCDKPVQLLYSSLLTDVTYREAHAVSTRWQ